MTDMKVPRPGRDHVLMASAGLWALRSTCSRAQVGVVVAKRDARILISGYNGAPAGMPHCSHECTCKTAYVPPEDWAWPTDHRPSCKTVQPCMDSVHGEANAIAYAARHGVELNDSQLFTTVSPCLSCSMLIINTGIYRVVYDRRHRETRGLDLLASAGVEVVAYEHG